MVRRLIGKGPKKSKGVELQIHLKTERPVELSDLGTSFRAFGKQYEEFVHAHGYDQQAGNAHLYVSALRTGSIWVTLKGLLEQGSFIVDHVNVLAGFMTNLHDLIEFFRTQRSNPPDKITRDEATRLARILEPVAKDGGAQVEIKVVGNTAPVTINNIIVNSERANAIQNNVRRFLGPSLPSQGTFEREVMYLQQMRGDSKSKVGDRGIIERFSPRPVRLHFMTPDVKAAILDQPENPFKMAYIVDGQMSTARGEPALYKVSAVHEALEKP